MNLVVTAESNIVFTGIAKPSRGTQNGTAERAKNNMQSSESTSNLAAKSQPDQWVHIDTKLATELQVNRRQNATTIWTNL